MKRKFTRRMFKLLCLFFVLILIFNVAPLGALAMVNSGTLANLPQGRYMICSTNSNMYVEYNESSSHAYISEYTGELNQRWELIQQSDNTYLIKNVYNELYLTSKSNVNFGSNMTFETLGTTNDMLNRQKWVIRNMGNGEYTIQSSKAISTELVWGVLDGSYVVRQLIYEDASNEFDRWYFFQLGEDVGMLGIAEDGHDHGSCFFNVMKKMSQTNYNRFNPNFQTNIDSTSAKLLLKNSEIFVSRSHGGATNNGTFLLLTAEGATNRQYLYSHEIHYRGATFVNLNGVKIAIFVGCNTAYDSSYDCISSGEFRQNNPNITNSSLENLVTASYNAGADVAIGFKQTIICNQANTWTSNFFKYLSEGRSVAESAQRASNLFTGDTLGIKFYSYAGNGDFTIN